MRTSCNGCRVLRKGCPEDCNIRPSLNWITSPDAQCNATVFLAKFYGRAGLMNFLNTTSDHHRAEIFKSLLYEACGRIVDPIYGAVGLLWSNNWAHCEAAVNAVLTGNQIVPLQNPSGHPIAALNSFDIRHVTRPAQPESDQPARPSVQTKPRSKRGSKTSARVNRTELGKIGPNDGSAFSAESVEEVSVANRVSQNPFQISDNRDEMGLELSLNLGPSPSTPINHRSSSVNP